MNNLEPLLNPQLYDQAFKGYPKQEMYRMYIDRQCQDLGKKAFENDRTTPDGAFIKGEPGYYKAMKNGFSFIRETMGKRIDVDFIIELHDICIRNLKGFYLVPEPGSFRLSYKTLDMKPGLHPERSYPFDLSKMTPEAIEECREEKVMYKDQSIPMIDLNDENIKADFTDDSINSDFLSTYDSSYVYSSYQHPQTESVPRTRINNLCAKYYQEIENGNSPECTLKAIVRLCRALEVYHVFYDGNQRTIAFCLLNKLLIENEFSPCILKKPNIFDGYYEVNLMAKYVEEGMNFFQKMKLLQELLPK